MQWENLKDEKCPKCDKALTQNVEKQLYECSDCGFRISNDKYKMITEKMK